MIGQATRTVTTSSILSGLWTPNRSRLHERCGSQEYEIVIFLLTFSTVEAFPFMEHGDPESVDARFVGLLTTIQVPLSIYVSSLLPGDPSARDVVQQANTTIWVKRTSFELGTNFKAWAFSIARFEVLNYRKQQARDARFVFGAELEQTIAFELVEAPDDFQMRHEALRSCLQKLRREDRDLLLHRYSQTGTLVEFATALGRSVGGLKVSLHRLRSAVLACMNRQLKPRGATP